MLPRQADLKQLMDKIGEHRMGAPAKAGVIAPLSVTIPAGPTGMDPSQTSFFQTLNIATKINKGSVEILNPVTVVTKGEKVSRSTPFVHRARLFVPNLGGFDIEDAPRFRSEPFLTFLSW